MGWNTDTGIPLFETLCQLEIDYTIEDLKKIKF